MYGYLYNDDDQLAQQNILIQYEFDSITELTNAPPIVQIDYDQNLYPLQQFQVSQDDVDTKVIWPIPANPQFPQFVSPMASDMVISKKPRYWAPKAVMMEAMGIESIQYAPGVVNRGWDTDAEQQFSQPLPFSKDSQEERELSNFVIIPTQEIDLDAEQQIPTPLWNLDITEDRHRLPVIPLQEIDLDAEQQIPTPLWNLDLIEERNLVPIIPTVAYDTDAEQQKLWLDYYKDHLSDEGTEKITVPVAYDTDAEQQFLQPLWNNDIIEERNLVPIIPIMEIDNDAEQQRLNPLPFGSDTVSDEGVEIIILPPPVTTFTWDDINEQSRALPEYYKDHLSDEGTEKITLPSQFYDTDADQQFLQPGWNNDIIDERNEFPIIPTVAYDTDAEQQKLQPLWSLDLIEERNIFPIVPSIPTTAYDNDAEQQMLQLGYQIDRDVTDAGVEKITLPAQFYDTDADQQRPQDPYLLDRDLSDTSVEKITLNPIVDYTWDNDAEQQQSQAQWIFFDLWDGTDRITISPNVIRIFVVGRGTTAQLISVSGSATPEVNASANIQPLINAKGEIIS